MKQLCLYDLVEELRHFRSSRGSSMIPDLALKRVMSLALALRSERGAQFREDIFFVYFLGQGCSYLLQI